MPDPTVGRVVLLAAEKDHPAQAAIVTAVGVDDEDAGTKLTDCWLTVLPAGSAPYATAQPVEHDQSGKKAGTWHWPAATAGRATSSSKAGPKAGDDDKVTSH